MRKTPEGWDMTLARMMIVHGAEFTPEERQAMVKYLADTQGLAPEESAPFRYILERRPNVIETIPDEDLGTMCARCHSYSRVALQRRPKAEWLKLVHFHLGQWPTIEYQALGRDRNWWEIASTKIPETLEKAFPLNTVAWNNWQKQEKKNLEGMWQVVGRRPGVGAFAGTLKVDSDGGDHYAAVYDLSFADGKTWSGRGKSIVYTGYEWRGSSQLADDAVNEVLVVSDDGNSMAGRWFLESADEVGGDFHAVRMEKGVSDIIAVEPSHLRAGTSAEISIHGVGLNGPVSLGDGVSVTKMISATPENIRLEVKAASDAADGLRDVQVGKTKGTGALAVYRKLDSVLVEPAYGIARVGGGFTPPVTAQFEAVGYLNGADGTAGTEDDVRVGVMPATWSVEDFNEVAADMKDVAFAGTMQQDGVFVPAMAGPNPQRKYSTNNAGDLKVVAKVADGDGQLEGSGRLIVTVQRWNDPPIR